MITHGAKNFNLLPSLISSEAVQCMKVELLKNIYLDSTREKDILEQLLFFPAA